MSPRLAENGITALLGIFFCVLCLAPSRMDGLFFAAPAIVLFLLWKEKGTTAFFLDAALISLLVFIALALVNALLGPSVWRDAVKLGRWIPPFLLGKFFVQKYPNHLHSALLWGAGFIAVLLVGSSLLSAWGVEQIGSASITLDDPELTFKNLSRSALYIALAGFIFFCHFLKKPSSWYYSLPAMLFMGSILILAGRRVTLAGFLFCAGLLLIARKKFGLLILGFAITVSGIIALNQTDRFNISPDYLASYQGVTERESVWYAAWKIFGKNPIFGSGVDTFREEAEPFVLEWFTRHPEFQRHETLSEPHNVILHTLAENGLVGTLLLLFIFGSAMHSAWKARQTTSGSLCLCGCLGVIFIHIQLQVHTVTNVAVLIFLLLGMARGLCPTPEQSS